MTMNGQHMMTLTKSNSREMGINGGHEAQPLLCNCVVSNKNVHRTITSPETTALNHPGDFRLEWIQRQTSPGVLLIVPRHEVMEMREIKTIIHITRIGAQRTPSSNRSLLSHESFKRRLSAR